MTPTNFLSRALRLAPVVASVLMFLLALVALHRVIGEFHLTDIEAAFRDIPSTGFAWAAAFTAASYFLLTQYERLAIRHVVGAFPYRRIALTSFIAYSIGHNLGVSALSGGAVRFRLYSAAGLQSPQIARIIGFGSLTFLLGATALSGVALIADADMTATLLHASPRLSIAAGALLLLAVAAYVATTALRRAPLQVRGWTFQLPGPGLTLRQIAVSAADLLCACATFYVLLPASSDVSFPAFAALFIVAVSAGVLSAVPGGLGVFEAVFLLLLPTVPPHQLLGVLVAYRLVYYALPFLLAIALLVGHELWLHRQRVARTVGWTGRTLGLVAPQAAALLSFGAGVVLLLSGSTPAAAARLDLLRRLLPLPVVELSHLAGSAIGVGLLILARGLYQRLDGARVLALWLLAAGIVASLLKGLDWEEAALLAAVAAVLAATRPQFHRRAALLSTTLSPRWSASVLMAMVASLSIALLAYRQVPYSGELWWQFAFDASAPRTLRAGMVAALVLGGVALLRLLAPRRAAPDADARLDEAALLALVRASPDGLANLALLGDKQLLFSESGRSFVMYAVSGRTWVAMGDPIGAPEEREELIWRFRELADQQGCGAAFYEISPESLAPYIDAGFGLTKLGEEARVDLQAFSLEGATRAALRQAHRRAQRDGLSFLISPPEDYAQLRDVLRALSDEWLATRAGAEKGFSLGYFDDDYLRHFPIALVMLDGKPVAFANVWTAGGGGELSVDLMRHAAQAPRSAMEFLFVELMLWGKAQGHVWFNLGMAPLSGLEAHRLAPLWHKFGRLVYRLGEEFYNFEGLRAFKEKFSPQWRPRYLATTGRLSLARVLLEIAVLISGGLRETVFRGRRWGATA